RRARLGSARGALGRPAARWPGPHRRGYLARRRSGPAGGRGGAQRGTAAATRGRHPAQSGTVAAGRAARAAAAGTRPVRRVPPGARDAGRGAGVVVGRQRPDRHAALPRRPRHREPGRRRGPPAGAGGADRRRRSGRLGGAAGHRHGAGGRDVQRAPVRLHVDQSRPVRGRRGAVRVQRATPRPGRLVPGRGRLTRVETELRYASGPGRWVLAATVLGSAIVAIDATVVGIALPAIGRDLGTGMATAIGAFLGGWVVQAASWRLIFAINITIAVVVVALAVRHVPESRDPQATGRVDVTGGALVTLGLVGLTYGLIEGPTLGFGDPVVLAALVGGVALLAGFAVWEGRTAHPELPVGLFG